MGRFSRLHQQRFEEFFNCNKRYSVTNKGLIAAHKIFLWAGVSAPGSVYDSTLLQSSSIFHEIESGQTCTPS